MNMRNIQYPNQYNMNANAAIVNQQMQGQIQNLGVSYSQPMQIPLPAHKQVIRKAIDRSIAVNQQP